MLRYAFTSLAGSILAATALCSASTGATAQTPEQFFKGKTVNLVIGYGPGGGYDFYGRLVARHLGRNIPGQPTVVPQNMPGAGSIRAANYIYSAAPKDGTAIGIVSQTVALDKVLGTASVQYNPERFNWIGRVAPNVDVLVTWHTSKVKTIDDAYEYEAPIAAPSSGIFLPPILNSVVGTKFKIISGYPGSNENLLFMEKGEVEGVSASWTLLTHSKQDWLKNKTINLLVQFAPQRHREIPDTPNMVEIGKTTEQKQILAVYASGASIGRSFFVPPDVPADRVKALRDGFDAMLKDPQFLAEVQRTESDLDPLSGVELQKFIGEASNIPAAVRDKAIAVRGK